MHTPKAYLTAALVLATLGIIVTAGPSPAPSPVEVATVRGPSYRDLTTAPSVPEVLVTTTAAAPEPEPVEVVEPSPQSRTMRQEPTVAGHGWADTGSGTDLGGMPAGCIRKYESGGTTDEGGDYSASGGGAFQIVPDTWDGYAGYARAEDAPVSVQNAKAAELWAEAGHQHWAAQAGRCF